MVVDRGCTEASADYHKDRFVGGESAELSAGFFVTFQKLLTDRSTGKDCLVCWKTADSLREVAAYFDCGRDTELVGEARSHI